jgi:hypothetical protein
MILIFICSFAKKNIAMKEKTVYSSVAYHVYILVYNAAKQVFYILHEVTL